MHRNTTIVCATIALCQGVAVATINPFTEPFATGPQDWRDNSLINDATYVASGALDGSGYITAPTNVDSAAFGLALAVRGQASFGDDGSSDGAFVGSWVAAGVSAISFDIRHDAPAPVSGGARIAGPFNFPGAAALSFAPILPNTWTTVTIPVTPSSPGLFLEGTSYNDVFMNVGNVQLGIVVSPDLIGFGTIVNVDVDNITLIPTPGAIAPLALAGIGVITRRRRA